MNKNMVRVAESMTTKQLMDNAKKMSECAEDYATDVLAALLTALDGRISEKRYVAFCESL